ncbi:hypothetical protein YYG_04636 [Plasmodium vinckei petteri]|nr:hypothetical protein YYG_04636 [Plasmodium vinckei petteri]
MKKCVTFREIDELFIDYEDKFNDSYGSYNNYCPVKNGVRKCETNYEKLSAISGHAYTELMQDDEMDLSSEYEPSADFLVMGLSHILYKLSKDPDLSLNDSFTKYLGNPIGGFNHWSILRNKKYFIGSNIGIMSGFYLLFQKVCETINTYETPGVQSYQYINDVAQCYIMYNTLYNFVNQCDPYLRLLDHLKTIYNELIDAVIKDNNYDESLRKQLIKLSPINKTNLGSEFNSKGCKKLHEKLTKKAPQFIRTVIKMLEDDEKRKSGDESQSTEDDEDFDFDFNLDLDDDDNDDDLETLDDTKDDLSIDTDNQNQILDPKQGNPNDGSADGKGDTDNGLLNTGGGQDDRGPGDGSDGDQGSQRDSGDGPGSAPVEKGPQSTSGDPFDAWPSLFNIAFKGIDKLSNTLNFFEKHKKKITEVTETINNLYNTSMSNIKNAYDNSRNFLNSIIDNINSQPEKVDIPSTLGGSQSGSNGTGDGLPTTNDPSPPQKDSPQTPSGTSHTSLPSPDPKDQSSVPQLSQDPPGNQSSDQNNQGGSKIPVANPVVKPENSVTKVKGNETTGIGDIYVLKEYKQIGMSIIVILIPITLAIMYKYLSSGWRKELKRKKNMKKVINSIGGKRSVQIIIKSVDTKKMTNPVINPVHREKKSLLNIYKLMQADPVPFINLFFLLIFFVYKRKLNYLEL